MTTVQIKEVKNQGIYTYEWVDAPALVRNILNPRTQSTKRLTGNEMIALVKDWSAMAIQFFNECDQPPAEI